jgi:hypothetical protein
MRKLQVEALESRRLLNGNPASGQFLPPQAPPAAPPTLWITERFAFVDYGGRPEVLQWTWSGEGGLPLVRLRNLVFGGFDGGERGSLQAFARVSTAENVLAETLGSVGRVGTNNSAADPSLVSGRAPALLSLVTSPTAPAAPVNNGAATATLPPILLQRLNPSPISFLEPPLPVRSLRNDVPGWFATQSPVQAPKVSEGVLGYAGSYGEPSRNPSGTSTADQSQQEAVVPSPKVGDLLAVLPFFDDSALDVGIQQFLEQLERLCPRLAGDGESGAAWPWIVAVTAAAAAGEIARRELKRPPVASAGEYDETGWFPPDHLFAG